MSSSGPRLLLFLTKKSLSIMHVMRFKQIHLPFSSPASPPPSPAHFLPNFMYLK